MGKALPDDLNTLKVAELKDALRERSLTISGVKADLVARLQEYLNKQENKGPAASEAQNGAKGDEQVKESEKEREIEKEKETSDKKQIEEEQREKELKEKEQKEKEQKEKEEKEKKEKELKEKEALKAKQLKEKEQKEKELREKENDTEEPEKDEETETKGGKKRKTTDDEEPTQSTPTRTLNHPSSSSTSSATSPSSPTNDTNKRARSTWTNKPQSITISSDILKEMLPTPSSPSSTHADAEMDDAGAAQDEARTSRPAQAVYSAPSRREKKEEEPAGPREVPASRKPASNTLYIDRFVRPFTIPQVKQLLSQTGEIDSFWMNQVKSQAYVTFKTVEQATATREAIFDLAWPLGNGSKLRAEFASEEEGKKAAEQHDLKRSAPTTTAATTPANVRGDRDVRVIQDSRDPKDSRDLRDSREVRDTRSLRDVRDSRDSRRPAPPPKKTLEDLFKKTVALPAIYWLGLTAEQIAAKKSATSADR